MLFTVVKNAPTELEKDEYIINAPSFMEEVQSCRLKRPRSGIMTANYIREILQAIGSKYIGHDFSAATDINISNFINSPCENEEQAHASIMRILKQQYPQMLDAYIRYQLKQRPFGTRFVYYLGCNDQTGAFLELGFEHVLEKDIVKSKKKKNQ
jgi:hypothetical protein